MSRPLRCTYRLQLGPGLGFAEARELVPYLADLGISHLYLSPIFQAREGSTHGYDVVDPTAISSELGGEAEFRALVDAAHEAGLGILQDIVPNHMATDDANRFWADERLRRRFFDIDAEAAHPPGYRRFFDIDHLAAVRQEDPEVFAQTHRLAIELVRSGAVDGLRIDHPDGLADPAGYLERLRDEGVERVWIEKILDPGEKLPDWPVEGTVGYEFLNDAAALYVDPAGEQPLTELYAEVAGERRAFGEVAAEAKREQARTTFTPEVERLQRAWPEAPADLPEALASLPVYRTYLRPGEEPSEQDLEVLAEAGIEWLRDAPAEFLTRFQQTTPPVMAKGVEDTAFYRYLRLLALNDVGGDPSRFGVGVGAFHAANRERAERFPRNLLITQTHDTKRSGDARARLGVLAGMADDWSRAVRDWMRVSEELREDGAPDDNERYLVFQTLLAAWPISTERLDGYLEKALREAKVNTNWVDQDHGWEGRVQAFARRLTEHGPFLETFRPLCERVAAAGHRAALGQLLLKLTVPGVPDVYQGDELVALSLVDPDNRRPIDWERRRALLAAVRSGSAEDSRDADKLRLIVAALDLRRRREAAFAGAYTPVDAGEDVCAFIRGDREVLVVCVLRPGGAGARVAAEGRWRDVLDGRERELPATAGELCGERGHALLERF